jgi:hypothetical protein
MRNMLFFLQLNLSLSCFVGTLIRNSIHILTGSVCGLKFLFRSGSATDRGGSEPLISLWMGPFLIKTSESGYQYQLCLESCRFRLVCHVPFPSFVTKSLRLFQQAQGTYSDIPISSLPSWVGTDKSLPWTYEVPYSISGLLNCNQVVYNWATSPPPLHQTIATASQSVPAPS